MIDSDMMVLAQYIHSFVTIHSIHNGYTGKRINKELIGN